MKAQATHRHAGRGAARAVVRREKSGGRDRKEKERTGEGERTYVVVVVVLDACTCVHVMHWCTTLFSLENSRSLSLSLLSWEERKRGRSARVGLSHSLPHTLNVCLRYSSALLSLLLCSRSAPRVCVAVPACESSIATGEDVHAAATGLPSLPSSVALPRSLHSTHMTQTHALRQAYRNRHTDRRTDVDHTSAFLAFRTCCCRCHCRCYYTHIASCESCPHTLSPSVSLTHRQTRQHLTLVVVTLCQRLCSLSLSRLYFLSFVDSPMLP